MMYLVTDIEFDYDDALDPISEEHKKEILEDVLGDWEADDEDDLIEEITACTGWCIKSLEYKFILS